MARRSLIGITAVVLLLGSCGGAGEPKPLAVPEAECNATACTVVFPAARGNTHSTGGPGTQVFGKPVQLLQIVQDTAVVRIGGSSVRLEIGQDCTVGGWSVVLAGMEDVHADVIFSLINAEKPALGQGPCSG